MRGNQLFNTLRGLLTARTDPPQPKKKKKKNREKKKRKDKKKKERKEKKTAPEIQEQGTC